MKRLRVKNSNSKSSFKIRAKRTKNEDDQIFCRCCVVTYDRPYSHQHQPFKNDIETRVRNEVGFSTLDEQRFQQSFKRIQHQKGSGEIPPKLKRKSFDKVDKLYNSSMNVGREQYGLAPGDAEAIVQDIFCSTKCYDLMQSSSKGTVFETTIPFQLAFFALVEHDTDVAPLWDPERRVFVGLMTVGDYIQALRIWRAQGLPTSELASRSIAEMMTNSPIRFQHATFQGVDAEDSVNQMCMSLLRSEMDYVPVVDPDNGNLVSILGYLDIVYLFSQTAKQNPQIFNVPVQQAMIGTFKNVVTVPRQALLHEVLDTLEHNKISAVPVVDESNRVIGSYHRSDVSFVIKAADADAVILNLGMVAVGDALQLKEQLLANSDIMSAFQGLVTVKPTDTLTTMLGNMTMNRTTRAVVVDDNSQCVGVVSIRDIMIHFLKTGSRN